MQRLTWKSQYTAAVAVCASTLLLVRPALSVDFDYLVGGGVTHTNNILRTSTVTTDETVAIAELGLLAQRESDDISLNVTGRFRFLNYDRDSFDDELLAVVNGGGSFRISPAIFWEFQENFGQIVQDPLAAVTPGNREDINSFSTGPRFVLDLGAGNSITTRLIFADVNYEITNNDNSRAGLTTSWGRQSTPTRAFSANAEAELVRYDDSRLSADFDRFRFFGHLENEVVGTKISLDLGFDKLEPKETIQVVDDVGTLVRLNIRRQLGEKSSITLRGASEFTDGGDRFTSDSEQFSQLLRPTSGGTGDPSSVISSNNFFEFSEVGLDLNRRGRAGSIGINGFWRDEDYTDDDIAPRDRTEQGGKLYLSVPFDARRQFDLYGGVAKTEYLIQKIEYDDFNVGLFFRQDVGRKLTLRLQADYIDRDANDPTLSYTEIRGSLNLYYGAALDQFAYAN